MSLPGSAADADKAFVVEIYRAFNAREIEPLLSFMTADVTWPNGMEGGYENGKAAVRAYWTRQWGMIDPQVMPQSVDVMSNGRLDVLVRQVIRDLLGAVLRESQVHHIYARCDGLIAAMEIEPVEA